MFQNLNLFNQTNQKNEKNQNSISNFEFKPEKQDKREKRDKPEKHFGKLVHGWEESGKIMVDFIKIIYIIQTMRNYEAMFIFSPKLDEEKLEKEIKGVEKIIQREGKGKVKFENLGKRTFAYPIKKHTEGYYVNYNFESQPSGISKIKDGLKHRDKVLRFIIFLKEKR